MELVRIRNMEELGELLRVGKGIDMEKPKLLFVRRG